MDKIEYEVTDSGADGTSLKGSITTTYDKLYSLFGKPTYSSGDPYDKVNTEWIIEGKIFFTEEDGYEDWEYVTASVYNWKTGGTPTETYDWHIGGKSYEAVELIQKILDQDLEPEYHYAA